MNETTLNGLLDIVQSVGMWAVFFYLYVSEKRLHEQTRQQYRDDLRSLIKRD